MIRMHVEPGNLAGVFGGLPLVVVEVRGDGDDRLADGLAEVVLGDELHLLEHHRAHLGDAVLLVAKDDAYVGVRALHDAVARRRHGVLDLRRVPLASDEALGRVDGVLGVGDRLALRDVADQPLARLGNGDHRRRGLVPPAVRDDGRAPRFRRSRRTNSSCRGRCQSPSPSARVSLLRVARATPARCRYRLGGLHAIGPTRLIMF